MSSLEFKSQAELPNAISRASHDEIPDTPPLRNWGDAP